jgi:hypothetical protein
MIYGLCNIVSDPLVPKSSKMRLPVLILALAAPALLCGCFHAAPTLRATAAQIGPEPDNYGEAVIPSRGVIVLQGDDVIYGVVRHGRRPSINGADEKRGPFTLADGLHRQLRNVTIVDHGYPGDTVAKSAERWAGQPVGNLLILSFGYGDFRAKTPVAEFTAALTKLVRQAHAQGAAVFIVSTPPPTDVKLAGVSDYRYAAQHVAAAEGVDFFDPGAALYKAQITPSKDENGSAAIYQAIAGAMVPYIQVVSEPSAKG